MRVTARLPRMTPKLTVRSPVDLLAAVPYLLGFHPTDSVVVVAMRDKRIIFAARGDLPQPTASRAACTAAAEHLATVVGRQGAQAATVLGYGPDDRVTPVVTAVTAALGTRGLAVMEELRVAESRYWSYRCESPDCCPPEGTPYDVTTSALAAAAAYAGQVALPDRAALVRQVAPIGGLTRESMRQATLRADDRLADLLEGAPPADLLGIKVVRAAGEAAVREAMDRHRAEASLTDDEVAWLSLLLLHVPVRDYAWERVTDEDWQLALWTDVLRRAEPELVPAPASLLAFAAWRSGQGALASVALERALRADPAYSMALLLEQAIQTGAGPSLLDSWPRLPAGARRRKRGRKGRRSISR
jgi:hypothetical protein